MYFKTAQNDFKIDKPLALIRDNFYENINNLF